MEPHKEIDDDVRHGYQPLMHCVAGVSWTWEILTLTDDRVLLSKTDDREKVFDFINLWVHPSRLAVFL